MLRSPGPNGLSAVTVRAAAQAGLDPAQRASVSRALSSESGRALSAPAAAATESESLVHLHGPHHESIRLKVDMDLLAQLHDLGRARGQTAAPSFNEASSADWLGPAGRVAWCAAVCVNF